MTKHWTQTYTGKAFDLLDPQADQICIEDIAHHLAGVARYTGATRVPYSVAQHCVMASTMVDPEHRLQALLHDAPEAYLNDLSAPLKSAMRVIAGNGTSPYDVLEHRAWCTIARVFGVPVDLARAVKQADLRMLVTEKRDLLGPAPRDWAIDIQPYDFTIVPWSADVAERAFLLRFGEL